MAKLDFEDKLRKRALEFIESLKSAGVAGSIVEDSFRQYAVKVSLSRQETDFGNAVIYYSPKSDSFSFKTHELRDKSIVPILEDCWHNARQSGSHPAAGYEIYVDGSFINGGAGYGAVILRNGKVVDELLGAVQASEVDDTRQVAGELVGVKEALNWCLTHSVDEVSIYYDYLGIEKWATRQWKTNKPLTQEYARFVSNCPIKVHWHKVASHTGNRWNDRADGLAKRGAGLALPGSSSSSSAATAETDLVNELIATTEAWIEFLMVRGVEACFDQIYNDQYARIFIIQADKPAGTVDLYNTRKKRLSPYLHNFRDDELKLEIEALWNEFRMSTNGTT